MWRRPTWLSGLEAAELVFNPNHRALPIPLEVASRVRFSYDSAFFEDGADNLLDDFGIKGGTEEIHRREQIMLALHDPSHFRRLLGIPTIFQDVTLEVARDTMTKWRHIRADLNQRAVIASALAPDLSPIPSREGQIIELALLRYYDAIDAKDLTTVFSLFANEELGEPEVVYVRGTEEPPIVGFRALTTFYMSGRKIQDGKHELDELVATETSARVKGFFTGYLKDGELADCVFFEDHFVFGNGKIIHRITNFPGREI
jgi:ketosteroid isomerase-like protein